METFDYPGYRCGPCPEGMMGNGTHCQDIDEVRVSVSECLPASVSGVCENERICECKIECVCVRECVCVCLRA